MGFEQTVLDRGWDEGISRLLGQVPSSEHRIYPNLGAETPVQIKHTTTHDYKPQGFQTLFHSQFADFKR